MGIFHPYCLFNHIASVISLDYVSAYSEIWILKEPTDLFFSMLTMVPVVSVVMVLKCFTPVSKYMLFRAILLFLLSSKTSPEQIPHNPATTKKVMTGISRNPVLTGVLLYLLK